MEINALPKYDMSENPTNCCPRFKPEGWDDQELHFKDKSFIKAKTRSVFHIPINMGSVYSKTLAAIEKAHAISEDDFIVLNINRNSYRKQWCTTITAFINFLINIQNIYFYNFKCIQVDKNIYIYYSIIPKLKNKK